jgi:hypothetical protein
MSEEIIDAEVTGSAVAVSAATSELVARKSAASLEVAINLAERKPRSIERFIKTATTLATRDPETARSCFYLLKRGTKEIQGESIRMAEIVLSSYQNLMFSEPDIIELSPTLTMVSGRVWDLETNTSLSDSVLVRTSYSDGKPYNDDMKVMAARGGISKLLRNLVFRVVPRALLQPVRAAAIEVAWGAGLSFEGRRNRVVDWIKSLNIDLNRAWKSLGVNGPADLTEDDLIKLTGIRTAIKDGDTTVDQAFPDEKPVAFPTAEQPKKRGRKPQSQGAAETPATPPVAQAPEKAPESAGAPAPTEPPATQSEPSKPDNGPTDPETENSAKFLNGGDPTTKADMIDAIFDFVESKGVDPNVFTRALRVNNYLSREDAFTPELPRAQIEKIYKAREKLLELVPSTSKI